jgi:flavin reductase (DIM6/NTAB) family NADH-FMN oxidoreductase RutF
MSSTLPAEPAPAAFDARAFRNALGSFPTGVAIITTTGPDGQPIGLTCNSFSSVSLDPPLVSWGLRLSSKNLDTFRQAGAFAINILAEDQKDLSARFASGSIVDKFEGVKHSRGHRGLPLIDDCVASFECDKFAEHMAGDHVLFLGQVVQFDHGRQEDSLVFYKGAYMMLTQSLRELAAKGRMTRPTWTRPGAWSTACCCGWPARTARKRTSTRSTPTSARSRATPPPRTARSAARPAWNSSG